MDSLPYLKPCGGLSVVFGAARELYPWRHEQAVHDVQDRREGKLVSMAVPKLADPLPFFRLDSTRHSSAMALKPWPRTVIVITVHPLCADAHARHRLRPHRVRGP